jgi:hypothetical protein
MRQSVIVSTTGNDPERGIHTQTEECKHEPEECESDHDRLTPNES